MNIFFFFKEHDSYLPKLSPIILPSLHISWQKVTTAG